MRPEVRVVGPLPAALEVTEEPVVLVVHSLIPVERGVGTKMGRTRGRKSDCGPGPQYGQVSVSALGSGCTCPMAVIAFCPSSRSTAHSRFGL